MADHTLIPHKCKGSLAIAEQTIEDCCGDPSTGLHVLLLATMIAGLKAGTSVGEMMDIMMRTEGAARCLLGMDEHAMPGVN